MNEKIEIAGIKIAQSDWNATPKSVKAVVTVLSERLGYIEEQIKQNSQNSSRPPSSDSGRKPNKSKAKKEKNKLECDCCGKKTRASLPKSVPSTGYGDRLAATVAWLKVEQRQSHRMIESLIATLLGVEISRGSIGRLRQQVSEAIAEPVKQAQKYVTRQNIVNSDETSFAQGNRDGNNAQKTKGWLWLLATKLVKVFSVVLSRSQKTFQELIGEDFKGTVISDRYSAYNVIDIEQRQLCWAHLKRDLTAIAERDGVSTKIGLALLRRESRLFRWWHRVRDGTMSREQFLEAAMALRAGFKAELETAAALPIALKEKSPLARTVRTARRLLKVEPALWTFLFVEGVEPTNNLAEQALRAAVIWRRTSFGSQSSEAEFVS